jgi:methylated-DNA-[protein]-cysteine S-methyltransferase
MTMFYEHLDTPVGTLLIVGDDAGIRRIALPRHRQPVIQPSWRRDADAAREPVEQLRAYFAGEITDFDLVLAPQGTPFQLRVWEALRRIPFGETRSYGELAKRIGKPTASRAVGAANGQNPISIVIPCHRVIGADGSLTGYAGGLPTKKTLLELEGVPVRAPLRARPMQQRIAFA